MATVKSEWKNKKIALLGFGNENKSVFSWLIKHGANDITICDKNEKLNPPVGGSSSKILIKNQSIISFQLGDDYLKNLNQYDIIFRTPGIPYLSPEIQKAKKLGVIISSQIKLFFDKCKAKIIGVTGTKGKGTTSSLIFEILSSNSKLKAQSSEIWIGGNIGKAPLDFLDKLTNNDVVLLELSSFQLQDLNKSPNISVVLDIQSDHLDHHKDKKEYVGAKLNIVKNQNKSDIVIINQDYLTAFKFALSTKAEKKYFFSRRDSVDNGAFISWDDRVHTNGKIILRVDKKDNIICKVNDVTLRGEHNLENICGAIIASSVIGASLKAIKEIVPKFKGLEHRLEFVGKKNNVNYYNDSIGTTPEATIAAIKSFKEPIILIVGGSSKGADYSNLTKEIAKSSVKVVIAIGETGPEIAKNIKNSKICMGRECLFY